MKGMFLYQRQGGKAHWEGDAEQLPGYGHGGIAETNEGSTAGINNASWPQA